MKKPDLRRVRLSELFSLQNTPPQFQVDLWKKALSASAVFCVLTGALAAAISINQDEGSHFDLHDDAQAYVDHSIFANPAMDKDKLQTETMKRADDAERNRLAGILTLTLLSGAGAGYSYKKLKTAQGKLTP